MYVALIVYGEMENITFIYKYAVVGNMSISVGNCRDDLGMA